VCGGAPFVKAVRVNDDMNLYFGTRCGLHRFTAPIHGMTVDYANGVWQDFEIERDDRPRDLSFDRDKKPLVLATNGGLQKTTGVPTSWHFAGGGLDGYDAYQISDLKGQYISSVDHTDLYAATRDNFFWAADVDGNIDVALPQEAFFVDAERKLAFETFTRITWASNNPNGNHKSGWQFSDETGWSNAPAPQGAPVLIDGDRYVQPVLPGLGVTSDAGSHWQTYATFPEVPRGLPKLGRAKLGRLVLYQTFRAGLADQSATRLMRITDAAGFGSVAYPAMVRVDDPTSAIGLGVVRTPTAMYPVYGVDPRNASHVIAPDIINDTMLETTDGGEQWHDLPALRNLVTHNGELLMHTDLEDAEAAPLVTAVSFSPDDPSLVLVGTRQGGIYMSGDRGATWSPIQNSELIPWVTSFYWQDANTIFFSTYGRGLWKLQNIQVAVPTAFGDFCTGCTVTAKAFDDSLLVFNGKVLGVRTEKGVLREVFVTPGSSVVFTGNEKDLLDEITITRTGGKETGEPLPKGPDGTIATGVVFASDHTYAGAAFAKSELSLLPPESDDDIKGSTDSPTKGKPYIRLTGSAFNGVTAVAAREVFTLSGTSFAAGASYNVLVDGVPLPDKITADGGGALNARLAAPTEAGYHRVEVRDAGKGTVIDRAEFLVLQAN
jgi:hypothetical protein